MRNNKIKLLREKERKRVCFYFLKKHFYFRKILNYSSSILISCKSAYLLVMSFSCAMYVLHILYTRNRISWFFSPNNKNKRVVIFLNTFVYRLRRHCHFYTLFITIQCINSYVYAHSVVSIKVWYLFILYYFPLSILFLFCIQRLPLLGIIPTRPVFQTIFPFCSLSLIPSNTTFVLCRIVLVKFIYYVGKRRMNSTHNIPLLLPGRSSSSSSCSSPSITSVYKHSWVPFHLLLRSSVVDHLTTSSSSSVQMCACTECTLYPIITIHHLPYNHPDIIPIFI